MDVKTLERNVIIVIFAYLFIFAMMFVMVVGNTGRIERLEEANAARREADREDQRSHS